MTTSQESRRFVRVPVGYRVKVMADFETIPAVTVNISLGGLYLHTSTDLPLGKPCHIIVFVEEGPSVDKILAWGTVARKDLHGLAVRFTQILGDRGMERLESFLARHAPDPGVLAQGCLEELANPA